MPIPQRQSVDLSAYPELVVIYLGFRVKRLKGVLTTLRLGRGIRQIAAEKPDGLLSNEMLLYSFNHIGMRQYWRDLPSLEKFTRSEPHRTWWSTFLKDDQGSGFWHETYLRKGGIEAIYVGMPEPIGLAKFAPARPPDGPFFSSRERLGMAIKSTDLADH